MHKIMFILVVLCVSCGANHDPVLRDVEQIKKEIISTKEYCAEDVLKNFFERTLNIIENKQIADIVEDMRNKAYEADKEEEWKKLHRYITIYRPIIKIVIGGEANYISPDMEYFLSKSKPDSVSSKFFSLSSRGGWYDRKGMLHGGKQYGNFPDWIVPKTGLEGEYDYDAAKDYLLAWQKLKPELTGIYREIADSTINKLSKICKK
ncbi:MAG TPA: hypothetical protein PLA54_10345 [Spirochaetota bacterium]|nr:hypothetical protein [Spirochaetota bacterium]HQE59578.1 hypothetical protein [Spirochaetota bacterium]